MISTPVSFTLLIIGGFSLIYGNPKAMAIPNPASQNCIEKGGDLLMSKRGDGGTYGVCVFEDNRQCEEWAMFRRECPVGGLNISGYLTPEGIYCALKGGNVRENETLCDLPSGKTCSTQDLYSGKCL